MSIRKIIDEEVRFEDINPTNRPVVSKTDIKGIITYTNTVFQKLAGYTKEELLNKPHNIVRHPDMPKEIFKNLWETILNGDKWQGIIKNLRKDGRYYWVEAYIEPIKRNNIIIGFISARRAVPDNLKKLYSEKYKILKAKENN
jgi:aerotaxis receptor